MRPRRLLGLAILTLALAVPLQMPRAQTPVQGYRIVATHPHDSRAFTQGLLYHGGQLYESAGQYGQSRLRVIDLASGRVLRERRLADELFAEGIAYCNDAIIQLTWRAGAALEYDAASLQPGSAPRFRYAGEGWGLTHDGRRLILSDGSATLRFLDPRTGALVRTLAVYDENGPVTRLNELEYVAGEIWANIWHSKRIARIDPQSGRVRAYLDLTDLGPPNGDGRAGRMLNGIAWDAASGRLFVTGKYWSQLYEIRIGGPP